jgi:molybdopterin-guanine dinucleotide biosynthesis protein A
MQGDPDTMSPGVILAGGRATRMGGGDKGLRPLAGRPLIAHVIARLGPQVAGLAINANGDPARFAAFGLPVLPDSLPDCPGPLAGVLAGLDWAAGQGARGVVTIAADTPFVPHDLVARLHDEARRGLCLAASADETGTIRTHPTLALWPVTLRDDLRAVLRQGMRKMMLWAQAHDPGIALFDSTGGDPFFNVNTPQDLARAEALAAAQPSTSP